LNYTSIPEPVYTAYTFVGWAYDDAGVSMVGATDLLTADDTLYAIWNDDDYTITYNLDGGTNHVDNPAIFDINDLDITLGVATKTGYTFGGWYEEAELTNAITTIDAAANIAIFAKFTET